MINITNMELYDIYIEGNKEYSSISEEEMLEITQNLAEDYYHNGFPHPDEIEVRESKKGHLRISAALKIAASREQCDWIEVDDKNLKGVFKSVPDRTDLSTEINENLIVELYSK